MNFFDDYFVFSNSEKKGIFIFVIILFSMILFYMVMPSIFTQEKFDFTEIKNELEAKNKSNNTIKVELSLFRFNPNTISKDSLLLLGLSSKQSYNLINYRNKVGNFKTEKDFRKIYSISDSLANVLSPYLIFNKQNSIHKESSFVTKKNDSLFIFDPNTVSNSQLQTLGFSDKQAGTFMNFKNKGGKFYKKEDLKKIYSVSEDLYKNLEPYIEIRKEEDKANQIVLERISLNTASKEKLVSIRGIGIKTAERIINFRNKLGGYSTLNQLDEVYGLDTLIKAEKQKYFYIETNDIVKLNLNVISFKELLSHPYCDYNTTKKIINYREMHGDFERVEQILENNLIKAKQYRKIVSYLTLK